MKKKPKAKKSNVKKKMLDISSSKLSRPKMERTKERHSFILMTFKLCPLPIRYEYIVRKIKIKEKAVFFFSFCC